MGKAAIITPIYLSFAWFLIISYQLVTETAVTTFVGSVDSLSPVLGGWLVHRLDMIVFIYAFAWVFVLSSVIPSVILGDQQSVLIQFFVCLTLTFAAFLLEDVVLAYWGTTVVQFFSLTVFLSNPFIAILYLLIPYIIMVILDVRARKKMVDWNKLGDWMSK